MRLSAINNVPETTFVLPRDHEGVMEAYNATHTQGVQEGNLVEIKGKETRKGGEIFCGKQGL